MIGPVQLLMVGFNGSRIPDEVRRRLRELHDDPAIRVIDLLVLRMAQNRTLERTQVAGLVADPRPDQGSLVDALLTAAGAARTLSESASGGRGYLFRGDEIPDLRRDIRPGTGAVAVLLEHRWAIALRDAVMASDAFPVADGWIGRNAMQRLNLTPAPD